MAESSGILYLFASTLNGEREGNFSYLRYVINRNTCFDVVKNELGQLMTIIERMNG